MLIDCLSSFLVVCLFWQEHCCYNRWLCFAIIHSVIPYHFKYPGVNPFYINALSNERICSVPVSFKRLYLSIIKPHLLLKRHVRNPEAVFCYLVADWLAIAVDLGHGNCVCKRAFNWPRLLGICVKHLSVMVSRCWTSRHRILNSLWSFRVAQDLKSNVENADIYIIDKSLDLSHVTIRANDRDAWKDLCRRVMSAKDGKRDWWWWLASGAVIGWALVKLWQKFYF